MHSHSIEPWQHQHAFLGARHGQHERRVWIVVLLTSAMMVAEIVGGYVFGSMALVADGWHMSTHAAALAIAAFAYRFARKHVHDPRFSFGTGKLGELAGFASAVILAMIALLIAYESTLRMLEPVPIRFEEAIAVAALGLAVNLVSAWLLGGGHDHEHDGDDDHHHDHNLRSAYLHVLADATTSILAIMALLAAGFFGWIWMDPAVGIIGAGVIAVWSFGLIRSAGAVLLDMVPEPKLSSDVRRRLEVDGDKVADLHLWRVGPGHTALIATIISDRPQSVPAYKARLAGLSGLSHVTVEIHACADHAARALAR
jgi:cation diffusion facilitator family transporter